MSTYADRINAAGGALAEALVMANAATGLADENVCDAILHLKEGCGSGSAGRVIGCRVIRDLTPDEHIYTWSYTDRATIDKLKLSSAATIKAAETAAVSFPGAIQFGRCYAVYQIGKAEYIWSDGLDPALAANRYYRYWGMSCAYIDYTKYGNTGSYMLNQANMSVPSRNSYFSGIPGQLVKSAASAGAYINLNAPSTTGTATFTSAAAKPLNLNKPALYMKSLDSRLVDSVEAISEIRYTWEYHVFEVEKDSIPYEALFMTGEDFLGTPFTGSEV